ncbi:MAG: metal-dependent hydrolase [Microthrixaceae bacterium]
MSVEISKPASQTSDETVEVPVRRISFGDGMAALDRHFAGGGDLLTSHLLAALSSLFPDGEDFFVRSVRHYRDRVTDPHLRRQVKGFIGQEALHGREHRIFNERLAELGYPTRAVGRIVKTSGELRTRRAPAIANLAITAALEHFTATLAEVVLQSPELRDTGGAQVVTDLFTWHALEEAEHKAVAFDVYRAVGGSERLRIWTMRTIRPGLTAFVALIMSVSLARDPAARRPTRLRESWRYFRENPLITREVWKRLKDYDRRGFHPDDHDTTALVSEWRDRLFGSDGELNTRLAA